MSSFRGLEISSQFHVDSQSRQSSILTLSPLFPLLIFVARCYVAKSMVIRDLPLTISIERKLIEASRGKANKGFQQLINDRFQ